MNAVLSGFFFSLLPVVKKHWERAVKENPKYVAYEGRCFKVYNGLNHLKFTLFCRKSIYLVPSGLALRTLSDEISTPSGRLNHVLHREYVTFK